MSTDAGTPRREPDRDELTRFLLDLGQGQVDAEATLMPVVYAELKAIAEAYLGRHDSGTTLQPGRQCRASSSMCAASNRAARAAANVDLPEQLVPTTATRRRSMPLLAIIESDPNRPQWRMLVNRRVTPCDLQHF